MCACVRVHACARVCVCTANFHGFLKGNNFLCVCVFVCFHIGCSQEDLNTAYTNRTGFLPTLGLCLNKDS